ncbi:MAG: four helix bundle protein [bacterium]|nr:four helix bundle protein [bacterium]
MSETQKNKPYDLEKRTFLFAKRSMGYFKTPPRTLPNIEIGRQGVRSSGSVGANFIEANEALSRKDFMLRIKICRKEAKETIYWLRLSEPSEAQEREQKSLIIEATELMKIFGSIIEKSK